jgi:hypothetical protein
VGKKAIDAPLAVEMIETTPLRAAESPDDDAEYGGN